MCTYWIFVCRRWERLCYVSGSRNFCGHCIRSCCGSSGKDRLAPSPHLYAEQTQRCEQAHENCHFYISVLTMVGNEPAVMLCHVILWYVMLWYVMICYVMLCYDMICYVMICYVMLCHDMIWYVMLWYVMLWYVTLCYATLCYAMWCYEMKGRHSNLRLSLLTFIVIKTSPLCICWVGKQQLGSSMKRIARHTYTYRSPWQLGARVASAAARRILGLKTLPPPYCRSPQHHSKQGRPTESNNPGSTNLDTLANVTSWLSVYRV